MTNQTAATLTSPIAAAANEPSQGLRTDSQARIASAFILIAVGLGSLALRFTQLSPNAGAWVVLAVGLGFLAAFAYARHYGFLVPAGIVSGLGAGILATQSLALTDEQTAGVIVLGLGLGFVSIWVIGAIANLVRHHWWPLIPGGILATIGVALLIGSLAVEVLDVWPVALIGFGVIVLGRTWTQSRAQA